MSGVLADLELAFDLGDRRCNWTNARWWHRACDPALDLAGHDLELEVETAAPRADVGVYLAVRERGGCWWLHPWACGLGAARNRGIARLADFHPAAHVVPPDGHATDDDGRLDPDGITAIAIGTINPGGAGRVAFTVRSLRAVAAPDPEPDTVAITVGGLLDADGTRMVPAGLFGGYNLPPETCQRHRLALVKVIHHDAMTGDAVPASGCVREVIHTIGDRVRPSPRLTHPDWAEASAATARRLAGQAQGAGGHLIAEYWNEPYLNWANRNRASFIPALYDEDRAVEGGPVHIRHDGAEVPHLRWTRRYEVPAWQWLSPRDWRRGRDAGGRSWSVHAPPYKGMDALYGGSWQPQSHPPVDCPDGAEYTAPVLVPGAAAAVAMRLTAYTPWHIHDETQFTFWSGAGMRKLYEEPMLAFGTALKQADPAATFLAGWQHRPGEDHWAAWELLYRPTIDAGIAVIDGVTDHDYGGDPRRMTAQAMVVRAYGLTRHGKALTSWNTECAASADPQAMPVADAAAKEQVADRRKRRWTAARVLDALAWAPAVMRACCHFGYGGNWFSEGGDGLALDQLIALRGRLLVADSSDPDLLAVASVDGSDPEHPRPPGMAPGQELVVAVLNHSSRPRRCRLRLGCPPGTALAGPVRRVHAASGPDGADRLVEETAFAVPGRGEFTAEAVIPGREAVVWRAALAGGVRADAPAEVVQRTAWSPALLSAVGPGRPLRTEIAIAREHLAGATAAWLELGLERVADGAGWVRIAGRELPLPRTVCPEDTQFLRRVPLDPAWLAERTPVEVRCADGCSGFLVTSLAVVSRRGG